MKGMNFLDRFLMKWLKPTFSEFRFLKNMVVLVGLVFVVLFSEINHLAPAQQKEVRGRIKGHHALIRETLRELAENGRLRSLDVNIATMHFMNAITGVARWKYQDFASDEEHLIHETVAYTMAALLKPAR